MILVLASFIDKLKASEFKGLQHKKLRREISEEEKEIDELIKKAREEAIYEDIEQADLGGIK